MRGGTKDDTQDDAAVLGVILDVEPVSDDFEVWPENWPALEMFLRCQTQWRMGMNGVVGLDYGAVAWVLRLYEAEDQHRALLEDLQVMEAAVISLLSQQEN